MAGDDELLGRMGSYRTWLPFPPEVILRIVYLEQPGMLDSDEATMDTHTLV